jgi:hypothetical protein
MNVGDVVMIYDTSLNRMWKTWNREIVLIIDTKENMGLTGSGHEVAIPVAACMLNTGIMMWFPSSILEPIG